VGLASKNGASLIDTMPGVRGSEISVAGAVEKYLPAKISSFPPTEIGGSARYSNRTTMWDSAPKFVALPEPLSAQADIARLLGPQRLADVKNGFSFDSMRTVETELGKVDLKVMHRSNMSELYFHVPDTDTAGTALTFQIDKSVLPSSRLQVLDTDGIFSGLFKRAGWNGLAANVKGANEHAFHRRLTSLTEAERTRMLLNELLGDSTRHMQPAGIFVENKAGFVPQGKFGVAPLETPLHTSALDTCGSLVAVDKTRGIHYLSHVDAEIQPAQIRRSLAELDLAKSELFIMPGKTQSGVPQTIYSALKDSPGAVANLKFVDWNGAGMFPSITSYRGVVG
jgi:hypothetical protein